MTFSGADVLNAASSERRDPEHIPLDRLDRALEGFLRTLLIVVAFAVIAGGVWIARNLDAGSRSQGGVFYVGLGVLVVLGGVLKTYRWLIIRRRMIADPSYDPDE